MTFSIHLDTRMLEHTGIGTYVRGLLDGISEIPAEDNAIAVQLHGKPYKDYPRTSFGPKIYSVMEQLVYPSHLKNARLWHAPHYNIPLLRGKTKLIVTIHDLIHWVFRHQFLTPIQILYAEKMLKRAIQDSDHIITVSQKTKNDMIEYFDADPDKISVTYEAAAPIFSRIMDIQARLTAVKNKFNIPSDYFLYVGMIKPHKNVLWLAHLFHKIKEAKRINSVLVLVGKKDTKYPKEFKALAKLEQKGEIIHIPYVSAEDLVTLYNGALALIHPSLYEGFGLTLLEAMACETPVIACRSASIPEVVGDAGLLVESCADNEMMDAIIRIEKFPNLRRDYAFKGLKQVHKFSWKKMAEQTLQIYEKVLSR